MSARQVVARHCHQQVMLEVVVDEVRGDQRAHQPVRMRRARVAEGIVVVGRHRMLGDTANAHDQLVESHVREHPQRGIEPPVPARREYREDDRVGDDRAVQPLPSHREPMQRRHVGASERAPNQRGLLLVCGLPGEIANHLAPHAAARDRKRRRQPEVGIVLLLREPMVPRDVVGAVCVHVAEQRVVGQPGPGKIVQLHVAEEQAVRRVMRQNREPELARADDQRRRDEGQRIRPPDEERHRAEDDCPRVKNHPRRAPLRFALEREQFVVGENATRLEHDILQSSVGPRRREVSGFGPSRICI